MHELHQAGYVHLFMIHLAWKFPSTSALVDSRLRGSDGTGRCAQADAAEVPCASAQRVPMRVLPRTKKNHSLWDIWPRMASCGDMP